MYRTITEPQCGSSSRTTAVSREGPGERRCEKPSEGGGVIITSNEPSIHPGGTKKKVKKKGQTEWELEGERGLLPTLRCPRQAIEARRNIDTSLQAALSP